MVRLSSLIQYVREFHCFLSFYLFHITDLEPLNSAGRIFLFIYIIFFLFTLGVFAYEVDLENQSNLFLEKKMVAKKASTLPYDGCCKNCLDGSKPACPVNYSYWCVSGAPQCCMNSIGGLDCINVPSCFSIDTAPPQKIETLCNENTTQCPDGSKITCPEQTKFYCLSGFPTCCKKTLSALECEEGTPECFYTRSCNVLSNLSIGCCKSCPDSSFPKCPEGTSYWCQNGEPSCCRQQGDELFCVPEEPACFNEPKLDQKNKCTIQKGLSGSCSLCPDGSNVNCPQGKEYWSINNTPNCCDNNGNNCTGKPSCFDSQVYKCPYGMLSLPSSNINSCCVTCPNFIDRPYCNHGSDLWCVNGQMRCGSNLNLGGKIIYSSQPPLCPQGGTRVCK